MPTATGFLALLCLLLCACTSAPRTASTAPAKEERPVSSRLSVQQVKEAAAAKARANGFEVSAAEPWSVALQVSEKGYNWSAHLIKDGVPSSYWLHIDDATGHAEFVMPMIKFEQRLQPNADWLFKIDDTLHKTIFPISLETLLRLPALAPAQPTGGGRSLDGRIYLEYTLKQEGPSPERIEVRFYHRPQSSPVDPIVVTSAELAYVDAAVYRYRLVRDRE